MPQPAETGSIGLGMKLNSHSVHERSNIHDLLILAVGLVTCVCSCVCVCVGVHVLVYSMDNKIYEIRNVSIFSA